MFNFNQKKEELNFHLHQRIDLLVLLINTPSTLNHIVEIHLRSDPENFFYSDYEYLAKFQFY